MFCKQSTVFALVIMAPLALGACQERAAPTDVSGQQMLASNAASPESSGRYVVVFSAQRIPADFGQRIAALGGSIENALDSIGVATVTGLPDAAAAELSAAADVRAVESDAITAPQGGRSE